MAEIDFETFGRKLKKGAEAFDDATGRILFSESANLASEVARAYRAATGDGRLSGTVAVRKTNTGRPAPVSAKAKDVRKYGDGSYVGLVVPTGPWALLERPMPKHVIAAGYTDKQRRSILRKARRQRGEGTSAVRATQVARAGLAGRESKALRVPGPYRPKKGKATGVFSSVNHPGTKGRPVFSPSIAVFGPKVANGLCVKSVEKIVDGYRRGR